MTLPNYVQTEKMRNAISELRNCESAELRNYVKTELLNIGIVTYRNIVPSGPEIRPQESYAAVQNCVLPGSVPPPRAALVRALP